MNTRTRINPTRTLTALLSTGVLAAGLAIAPSVAASAHTPSVSADCSELTVTLESYASSRERPTPNSVTVTVDGEAVVSERFGASITRDVSLGESDLAHDWVVQVDAAEAQFDRTFSGESTPCDAPAVPPVPVAPDATAEVAVTPTACGGAAESLVLGAIENATWGTPTATTGPAKFSVTATATDGHLFADGLDTQVFTGVLAAPPAPSAPQCASAVVPAPPTPTVPTTPTTPVPSTPLVPVTPGVPTTPVVPVTPAAVPPTAVLTPVPVAVTVAAAPETLADTGADTVNVATLALALLAAGALLLAARGVRLAVARRR